MNTNKPGPWFYYCMPIRERGNMLCMTDMWWADGSDPTRSPARWLDTDEAKEFVAYIATTTSGDLLEVDDTHTWAHYQIALTYATWISPNAVHQGDFVRR